jgi:hypothetical protein
MRLKTLLTNKITKTTFMKNIVLLATALLLILTVRSQKTQVQAQKINTYKLKKSTMMENQSVKNEIL